MELNINKIFFSKNYIMDIFLFISAIISLLATTLTVYLLCRHKKLQTLIASLVLHQVKEVGTVTQKEINSECRTLVYIILVLTILGLAMVAVLHYRKPKFCKGHTFSNAVKMTVFISDVQNYIPIKLCSIHLFKITDMLKAENIKINKNYRINLPRVVTVNLQDKVKVRHLMRRQPLLFHLMLKQGITWYTLAADTQETV